VQVKKINYMKSIIKSFILLCVLSATLVSCETYSDPKVDYSPIYPLSGEWRVRITNLNTSALVVTGTSSMYTLGTYNTSDNSATQMWIRATTSISAIGTVKAKISCDVPSLSFTTTGVVQNLNVTTNAVIDTVTITDAKITLSSVSMPSGVKSDRIYFKFKKTKVPGVTYLVEGYRRTRWNEDETVVNFQ
jgi:hypothetical protein